MPRTREAVAAVRRHLDVDDGVAEADQVGVAGADRRVRRHLDDAFAVLAKVQLKGRAQHAARGDAADFGLLQHRAGARDHRAGRSEDALDAGARVRRTAHHLDPRLAGVDEAELQPVGIRVPLGRDHRGDGEGFEPGSAIFYAFDVVAEPDQALDDQAERRRGFEMGQQPGKRRLHRAPRTSEGMSSGRNP